ncbi:hypothetical protein GTP46_08370 [Duganella sp. FT135W]|uniref:SnoaL-like domain-containing protein n=1 Tax=Duganella flavida TaxID=2692175 RepID=A0A6L8K581_9BURK|nr:nuclear transport factor 2 family protein [Duganella flavida]MYM22659.1 hypothetical protein [Duganella flavida]
MQTSLEIVKKAYELLALKDIEGYLQILDESVVVTQSPCLPWGGRHMGIEGALAFIKLVKTHIDSQVFIEQFVVAGEKICVIGRTKGVVLTNQKHFDCRLVHIWSVSNGKINGLDVFIEDAVMLSALCRNE